VRCEVKGSNSFGEVTVGLLQISGHLKRMDFYTGEPQSPNHYTIGTFTCRERMELSSENFTPDRFLIGTKQEVLQDPLNLKQPFKKYYEHSLLLEKPVWCLGICNSYGLVLRESSVVPGAYTRIGLCENVRSLLQDAPIELITIC
jgi:hypothetical protein